MRGIKFLAIVEYCHVFSEVWFQLLFGKILKTRFSSFFFRWNSIWEAFILSYFYCICFYHIRVEFACIHPMVEKSHPRKYCLRLLPLSCSKIHPFNVMWFNVYVCVLFFFLCADNWLSAENTRMSTIWISTRAGTAIRIFTMTFRKTTMCSL